MVSISDMQTIKYCPILVTTIDTAKENIQKQCGVGDTFFTSLATIRGNLFTGYPKILVIYTKTIMIFC